MFIVKKDGLFLMGYKDFGIREIDAKGELTKVLTGIYSERREDAMLVEKKSIADQLGAEIERATSADLIRRGVVAW